MKRKYYIRGLAFGILITTLVFSFVKREPRAMTDEEILKRAEELGYVKAEGNKGQLNLGEIKAQELGTPKPTGTSVSPEPSETGTPDAAKDPVEDPDTTPAPTPPLSPAPPSGIPTPPNGVSTPSSEVSTPPSGVSTPLLAPTEPVSYTLKVTDGMTAREVSGLLAAAGMVESAEEFTDYLRQNGLTKNIIIGTYEISGGMTAEEIARLITVVP